MATFQDFQLDDNGDLNIVNGDFVVAPSDPQHIFDIIASFQGEWKEFPLVGVGIMQFLKSQNGGVAINAIKQQLQADGYSLSSVKTNISEVDSIEKLQVVFPNGIQRNG